MNEHSSTYNRIGEMLLLDQHTQNDISNVAVAAITNIWFKLPYLNMNTIIHKPYYDATVKGD